jgi:hypothetical protein
VVAAAVAIATAALIGRTMPAHAADHVSADERRARGPGAGRLAASGEAGRR